MSQTHLKMKQRKIKLIQRNTTGYGLDTIIHYVNQGGVSLLLEPQTYAEYLQSQNSTTLNTSLHNNNHYKITLSFKGLEVKANAKS